MRIHVLAAEDNRVDARLLGLALAGDERWQVNLVVLPDGEQTLAYLESAPPYEGAEVPDLLILDLNMPRCDGVEVLQAVRQSPKLRHLPVVILSSSPQEAIEDRVRRGGVEADAYLTKPFEVDEYLALGKLLRQQYIRVLRQTGREHPLKPTGVETDLKTGR